MRSAASFLIVVLAGSSALAIETSEIEALLAREIIGPQRALEEVQAFTEAAVPLMPAVKSADEWQQIAERLRKDTLEKVIFRGEAARWRDAPWQTQWLETIDGGPGYRIKKLRFEVLPGLWVPALLYEPEKLEGKVPVSLAVNGHGSLGKALPYKQVRCINMAKRGMLVLNLEWFNMGQLNGENFVHYRLNQLDLCGTSGVAPFYLAMQHGLDVLLSLEHADPQRVAVSGLSGGGWQTIVISSLDPRVTLANPVAGYSSFRTRARNFSDLGDSEQTPVDLAATADYAQLTAMRAPRPTLLTYNAKDDCCFAAGHALPPLLEAAGPIYKLFGKETHLRSHVNEDPGTHNYERDNREVFYRMLGDFFYGGSAGFDATEIECQSEVKMPEELQVELPAENRDFHKLAMELSAALPQHAELPADRAGAAAWQAAARERLRSVLRTGEPYRVEAQSQGAEDLAGVRVAFWQLRMSGAWTVPAVELSPPDAKDTILLVGDGGRKSLAAEAKARLEKGQRVLAVDPFYFGESAIASHDFLFGLLVSSVGSRPLGIQAAQLAAAARWAQEQFRTGPVTLVAVGPRLSLAALCAASLDGAGAGSAGLDGASVRDLEVTGALGSLKEVLEQNKSVDQAPELFCFGLLEEFDICQLAALAAPRPVLFHEPSERAKAELAPLAAWNALFESSQ